MKASPRDIVVAHYRTYVDHATGKTDWKDHALFGGPAFLLFVGCLSFEITIPTAASVGLLTVAGLLSAFLFGAMLQVSQRAMDWSDTKPVPSRKVSEHAEFLRQLAANAGYASLVSILVATIFVVASASSGKVGAVFTALGLGLAVHLMLVLSLVIVRVFALTQERLIEAETGGSHEDNASHFRRNAG